MFAFIDSMTAGQLQIVIFVELIVGSYSLIKWGSCDE